MKRLICCALLLVLLCAASVTVAEIAPVATPEPKPVGTGYVPALSTAMSGADAAQWKTLFFAYADEHGIPVEDGGFQPVVEWARCGTFEASY